MAHTLDFDLLVKLYYEPLYQFALSLVHDEPEACDLTQQTFCIWAVKGHQLRDQSKVKTWLFTTLHREFLGSRRKTSRFPQLELDQAAWELPVISPETISQLDGQQVLDALAKLDDALSQYNVSSCFCRQGGYMTFCMLDLRTAHQHRLLTPARQPLQVPRWPCVHQVYRGLSGERAHIAIANSE